MAFQPITSEWAQRHYREALTGGPVDRGHDEPATDAVSLELSGYIGMDEDEPLPVAAIHEHGDVAVGVGVGVGDDVVGVGVGVDVTDVFWAKVARMTVPPGWLSVTWGASLTCTSSHPARA